MLSLRLDPRTEALRVELQRWLRDNPPPQLSKKVSLSDFVEVSREWQSKLAHAHWVAVHWPEQHGGRGLTLVDEAVVQECLAQAGAPQLINLFGLTMVGPVLIRHGTDEQRARFLKPILTAEEIWCQGFSEPEAGSDLASVRTRAIRSADGGWEITGQKVWTSFAQVADWCFILASSDPRAPRYKGLSYFLMPMRQPGIEVRPLTQISGDSEFNELFLEGAQIPSGNIVGGEGDGWKIAISTLMYERVVLTFARHLQSEQVLDVIRAMLADDPAPAASDVESYGRLVAESMAVRALALSHLITYDASTPPGPEGSLDKLGWSESFQEICKLALKLTGDASLLTGGDAAFRDGLLQHQYLYSRGRTIAAGTSEIQRNIIAERVLGLPRDGKKA